MKNFTHSLFGKLLLIMIFGILLPLLGLGVLLTDTGEEAIRATVLQDHREIARRVAGEIEAFLREPLSVLKTTAGMMIRLGGSPSQKQAALVALSLEQAIFKHVALTDADGKETVTSDPEKPLGDRSKALAFIQSMKGQVYRSEMHLVRGELPTITLSVPVRDIGSVQGVLIAQIDARGIWDLMDRIKIGDTGRVSVFSKKGFWIAHPDKSRMFQDQTQQAASIQRAMPRGIEVREVVAGEVRDTIYAAAPVPGSEWVVRTDQSKEEALDMARRMKRQHRLFLISGFVLSILIGWGIAYSVSKPIGSLSDAAQRISQGDFGELPQTKRGDEIGELNLSFNRMVVSLQETLARLQAARDFSERIVENIPAGLIVLSKGMKVQRTNQALLQIMGAESSGDLIGRSIAEMFGSEKELMASIQDGLEGGLFPTQERRVQILDGREIEAVVTGASLSGPGGEIEGLLLLIQDVTDQRRLERQLIQSEKLASVGLISAGISHELKNPLNTIRWATSEVEEELREGNLEGIEGCTGSIKEAVRRCGVVINTLLDFTRPSPKGKEKVDINNLLDSVVSLTEEPIRTSRIEVWRNYGTIPEVEVNLDLMKQVFLNLITNAIQAMPDGGVLRVVTGQDQPNRMWIRVSDTGCGIPEKDLKNLFTPFFKIREGGTGLGLWVACSSIQRHGGTISVESREGGGSTFTVELLVGAEGK